MRRRRALRRRRTGSYSRSAQNGVIVWNLRLLKFTESTVEKVRDFAGIINNKNAVSGDQNAQAPGGIRLGTFALSSRSMTEADMDTVAGFLHRAIQLSLDLQKTAGSKLLKDFVRVAGESADVKALAKKVRTFAGRFPLPGVDTGNLKRPAGVHEDD